MHFCWQHPLPSPGECGFFPRGVGFLLKLQSFSGGVLEAPKFGNRTLLRLGLLRDPGHPDTCVGSSLGLLLTGTLPGMPFCPFSPGLPGRRSCSCPLPQGTSRSCPRVKGKVRVQHPGYGVGHPQPWSAVQALGAWCSPACSCAGIGLNFSGG